jgi:NAD(P)-dependent dehydrogenase (short-subunit alcohol dehydrogenase family)
MGNDAIGKNVLITGGTSGLGKSLVELFLSKGYKVYTVGRNGISEKNTHDNYAFYLCDLANLDAVRKFVEQISRDNITIDILINNAGVLSPPQHQETEDGHEYSYQVNFLSHVLLTRLLINKRKLKPGFVVNISSPVHKNGQLELKKIFDKKAHSVLQAYSNTKLFMALFTEKLALEGISGFSFNPGTFSSGIYQLQKPWFHRLYKIAAPFMVSSDRVAKRLYGITNEHNWKKGKMISKNGSVCELKNYNSELIDAFWKHVDGQIEEYIK